MRALVILLALFGPASAQERLRVMVEADAGGDPDDEQSMIRFLLYASEWDVAGVLCKRAAARERENLPEAGTHRGTPPALEGDGVRASFKAPAVGGGTTIHVILRATQAGEPPLARYRRVVVRFR